MALSDVCVLFSGANHRHIETAEEKTSGAADKRCAAVVTYFSKVQFNAQDSKGGGEITLQNNQGKPKYVHPPRFPWRFTKHPSAAGKASPSLQWKW